MVRKTLKSIKYVIAISMVFVLSWILGEKHSDQYSVVHPLLTPNKAHADTPHRSGTGDDSGGDSAGGTSGGDSTGGGLGGGVDAAGSGTGGMDGSAGLA